MLRHFIFLNVFCVFLAASLKIVEPGPTVLPTKGDVWPKLHSRTSKDTYYKYSPSFSFVIPKNGHTCDILDSAMQRYKNVLQNTYFIAEKHSEKLSKHLNKDPDTDANYKGLLLTLEINLSKPCERYPHLDMDEKYSLTVSATSMLKSDSIWGILRGLETFAQLFYISDDYKNVFINATDIEDFPKYTHRGLQIDTSRHYHSVATILKMLDAMEMNKMNVFHWHIVDDQSFPYQSKVLPLLSEGAYDPSLVYTAEDIIQIVEYARNRGIRVVPEFDVPGHTRSWGVSYPNILTKCYSHDKPSDGPILGPMDLTNNLTYQLIGELFREVQGLFPDKYFHIGGNEVDIACWRSNPKIREFMVENHFKLDNDLIEYFMKKVYPLLGDRSTAIVDKDVFSYTIGPLPNGTIVQVYDGSITDMLDIVFSDHKLIFSSPWRLDHVNEGHSDNYGDWQTYYGGDPREFVAIGNSNAKFSNVAGGEAYMRGDLVDDTNIITRVWPRTSAVAEILWSGGPYRFHSFFYGEGAIELQKLKRRMEEQVCQMNRRGIPVPPPNGAGFCITGN